MKLLLITQKVDKKDDVLSFMHHWIQTFAPLYEHITVICLYKGEVDLPDNVTVLSLGKEEGKSRFKYLKRFYSYIWNYRKHYDAVFVHMNQEYVLLGWPIWKMLGKKITMWRNHHAGTFFTRIAMKMCDVIFCTSQYSFTAHSSKTIIMPVGIDTDIFRKNQPNNTVIKNKDILFLGRISPVKKPHLLIEALIKLHKKGTTYTASIYGNPLPSDETYYLSLTQKVKEAGLEKYVEFKKGVPNTETPNIYNQHTLFVNLSTSGMYDKTIFEAASCEALILASNENLRGEIDDSFIFKEGDVVELSTKIEHSMNLSLEEKEKKGRELREYVIKRHSLNSLKAKLYGIFTGINNNIPRE